MSQSVPRPESASATADGDRDQWVLDYLPLVNFVLGRLGINLPTHVDREDLFSAGVIGLINAARQYDPDRGASFKTYAYTSVKGAILDELRRQDFLPRTQRERMKAFHAARRALEIRLGHPPRVGEIAREMGVPEREVDEILLLIRSVTWLSLDENLGGGYGSDLVSRYLANPRAEDPADAYALKELKAFLKEAILHLSDIERKVILLYYDQELLLKEIGEVIGISESRVSQIHSRAIYHLNQELEKLERVKPGRL
ncbi:MAG: FliA/WhiG family RNA polymerase sigma factor [Planctomycetes bacterium]|nr:FliA/WhiG family RNA polymerase sigma factor [Planctomycetota bacterium]